MIVVSDTTPLISLLKINRLDLLKRLFGTVIIPQAVFLELIADARFLEEADMIRGADYILVNEVRSDEAVGLLRQLTGLDKGESEAIVLSGELGADLLLMDEAKGRNVSRTMGINILGTIGMLVAAYEDGELSAEEALACVDGLQAAGRHIGRKHYQKLIDRIKEH